MDMNKIFLPIAFLLIISCDSGINPDSALLTEWDWVSSIGGFAGTISTPATTGENVSIEFTKSTYRKYVDGDLRVEMNYNHANGESIYSAETVPIITYHNNWRQSYTIKGDTLFLNDECFDCFGHVYVKK